MGWPLVRLDSLYDIARGGSPRPIKKFITDDSDGINWIKISDATASDKYIYETKQKIIPEGIKRSRFVKEGDFILSNSMSFGRPYIMGTSGCIHDGWLVLSSKNESVDQDFLYHILGSPFVFQQFDYLAAGSTVRNLNIDLVSSVKIPLLPIPEQKRIVAILDQVFADIEQARANTEQNLKNARELFESYLQQVFTQRGEGWDEHILGSVCTFKHGFAFKSEYFTEKSDLTLLTPGNFFEEGGYKDREEKQKYYDGPFPEDFLLSKGVLLVAMTEQAAGLLGSPALIPEDDVFLHNQRLGLVELTPEFSGCVSMEFLFHLFNTKYFRAKVQETASGVKVRHTSPKKMQSISIWLPSNCSEQESIASKLFEIKEKTLELDKVYKDKLKQLDELKKSILQKAFSGELANTESQGAVA